MPQPLYVKDIIDADIATTRSGSATGYRFTFKSADGVTTFGYIEDNGDSWSDDAELTSPVALRVDLTLVSDANFAIQNFDTVEITADLGGEHQQVGGTDIDIIFPAETGSSPVTLYIDEDGNTYTDAALTTPAGGVLTLSSSLSMTDSTGTTEFDINIGSAMRFGSRITTSLVNMTRNFFSFLKMESSFSYRNGNWTKE